MAIGVVRPDLAESLAVCRQSSMSSSGIAPRMSTSTAPLSCVERAATTKARSVFSDPVVARPCAVT